MEMKNKRNSNGYENMNTVVNDLHLNEYLTIESVSVCDANEL
jgi:hypothetical protein